MIVHVVLPLQTTCHQSCASQHHSICSNLYKLCLSVWTKEWPSPTYSAESCGNVTHICTDSEAIKPELPSRMQMRTSMLVTQAVCAKSAALQGCFYLTETTLDAHVADACCNAAVPLYRSCLCVICSLCKRTSCSSIANVTNSA